MTYFSTKTTVSVQYINTVLIWMREIGTIMESYLSTYCWNAIHLIHSSGKLDPEITLKHSIITDLKHNESTIQMKTSLYVNTATLMCEERPCLLVSSYALFLWELQRKWLRTAVQKGTLGHFFLHSVYQHFFVTCMLFLAWLYARKHKFSLLALWRRHWPRPKRKGLKSSAVAFGPSDWYQLIKLFANEQAKPTTKSSRSHPYQLLMPVNQGYINRSDL